MPTGCTTLAKAQKRLVDMLLSCLVDLQETEVTGRVWEVTLYWTIPTLLGGRQFNCTEYGDCTLPVRFWTISSNAAQQQKYKHNIYK